MHFSLRPLLLVLLVGACSVAPRDENMTSLGEVGSVTGDGGDGSSSESGGKLDVGGTISEIAEVFGHSADTLYRLDPETKEVTIVGVFDGCSASIIDIALDAKSNMFGTAYGSLWRIDKDTGRCIHVADGDYPTSLSFVPANTVLLGEEALVGFVDDEYIRIDPETGEVTSLGALSGGLRSSGDLVSVAGGGSYLTVVDDGACSSNDCLIEVDPQDGTVLNNYGTVPYPQVFGLAFWAGRAYGFARGGDLFEIRFVDDQLMTTAIDIPVAPAGLEFFGAGSTTSAPPTEQ
ncbi:MAG TPA: hypothetical protein VG755_43180 [Nannocystaceae bacterium]|nr:hypothetical protein [Nannocystaceae bacterium]